MRNHGKRKLSLATVTCPFLPFIFTNGFVPPTEFMQRFKSIQVKKRSGRMLHYWTGFSCLCMSAYCYFRQWGHPACPPAVHLMGRCSCSCKSHVVSSSPWRWLGYPKVPPKIVLRSALPSLDPERIANTVIQLTRGENKFGNKFELIPQKL